MVKWRIVYTGQAQKGAKKIAAASLRQKAKKLLEILSKNPFQTPPRFEELIGDLSELIPVASLFNTVSCTKSCKK